MKNVKTSLFIAVIAAGMVACAKKIPADEVKGTVNGNTITWSASYASFTGTK